MISKERLEQEILSTKEAIEKLKKIESDCITGIEVNGFVLKSFEEELTKL